MSRIIRDSLKVGLLLCVPGAIAWVTGLPFIFPSLGPSAFSLVTERKAGAMLRTVIGGHLIGVVGGLLAYHGIAEGLSFGQLPPSLSLAMLRLAGSGVISVILTTVGMLAADARHPPACATTLIVSLGIMATLRDALFIMIAVIIMCAVHRLMAREA